MSKCYTVLSQPPSPAPSASSSDVLQSPAKRKKSRGDEVEEVILCSLKSLQERRRGKEQQQQSDEEAHFGQQIAATLRRFTPRQKALAKLQIELVLFSVEFPPEFPL